MACRRTNGTSNEGEASGMAKASRQGRDSAGRAGQPPDQDLVRDAAFQHKLEQFDPGIVWLDGDQRVIALNDTAQQILGPAVQASMGVAPSALIGSNVLDVHPPKSRE
jgi:PAS domain-containing protein